MSGRSTPAAGHVQVQLPVGVSREVIAQVIAGLGHTVALHARGPSLVAGLKVAEAGRTPTPGWVRA